MSKRCDYCSGFGCIGECHDLPLPGAPIAPIVPVAPIATTDPVTITTHENHAAYLDLIDMMKAETGQEGRPGWHVVQSGPAFWGYGRPGATVWSQGVDQWGWRVYESQDVTETTEGVAGLAWDAMLAAEDRLAGRSNNQEEP